MKYEHITDVEDVLEDVSMSLQEQVKHFKAIDFDESERQTMLSTFKSLEHSIKSAQASTRLLCECAGY